MSKMLKKSISAEMIKIYKGYYIDKKNKNILLAISLNKKLLKEYLENTRNLNSKDYEIESEIICEAYLYSKYEDYLLEEFLNRLVTNKEISIIMSDCNYIERDICSTIYDLEYLKLLMKDNKKTKKDVRKIRETIEILRGYFKDDDIIKKLNKSHKKYHPIFNCSIVEYLKIIERYDERMSLIKRYEFLCIKD